MKINILKSAIGCLTATGFLLSATASYAEDTLRTVSYTHLTLPTMRLV